MGRRSLRTSVTSDRNFYIVGILRTAKEEFLCTEKHVSIVPVTITTLNLEFDGRNIYGVFFCHSCSVYLPETARLPHCTLAVRLR